MLLAGASQRMGQFHPRYLGHAQAVGGKVALWPKIRSHQGDGGQSSLCCIDAVTHGAGSTAASVPVGGDDRIALRLDLFKHGVWGGDGGIALIPNMYLDTINKLL